MVEGIKALADTASAAGETYEQIEVEFVRALTGVLRERRAAAEGAPRQGW